jgi:hypothetical protein
MANLPNPKISTCPLVNSIVTWSRDIGPLYMKYSGRYMPYACD